MKKKAFTDVSRHTLKSLSARIEALEGRIGRVADIAHTRTDVVSSRAEAVHTRIDNLMLPVAPAAPPVDIKALITAMSPGEQYELEAKLACTSHLRRIGASGLTMVEEALVKNRQKIRAIMSLRARSFLGLKEAKEIVDDYAPGFEIQRNIGGA